MRVLHVIESLAPAGAEQVLVNTVPAMRQEGVVADVVALWGPYDLAHVIRENGSRVYELNLSSTWSVLKGIAALRRLIIEEEYEVIHAHLPMAVFYSALAKKSVPLVTTFHGLSFEYYPALTIRKRIRRKLEQWWTNYRVDAYIAVSATVAEHYSVVLRVPRNRINVIPNGFPVSRLKRDPGLDVAAVRGTLGLASDDFLLLNVGRLIPQKGHVYLLQAASQLCTRGAPFKLIIIGHGIMIREIKRFIDQNHLGDCVKVIPPVSQSELLKILQVADLFVFPSVSEGFGMAAGEAMCMELPVIASHIPSMASLIEDGISGVLVPPADPQALATSIERLIANPENRRRMGREARKRIQERFSIDKVASEIVDVYETLIRAD